MQGRVLSRCTRNIETDAHIAIIHRDKQYLAKTDLIALQQGYPRFIKSQLDAWWDSVTLEIEWQGHWANQHISPYTSNAVSSQLKGLDSNINVARLKPPRTLFEQQKWRDSKNVWSRPTGGQTALPWTISSERRSLPVDHMVNDTTRRNAMYTIPYGLTECNVLKNSSAIPGSPHGCLLNGALDVSNGFRPKFKKSN